MKKLCLFVLLTMAFAGCEQYVPVETATIGATERDYVLAFVLDTSGSFADKMFDGNQIAYKFFMRSADQFFRNRMGDHDRILISQMSGDRRTLLWEGSPLALRRRFGSSESLKQFIQERSNPAGSRVYASLADTLDYLYGLPGVSNGETQVCILVLSDMLDNSLTPDKDRSRMIEALQRFAKIDGGIGLYWVDQFCLQECRQSLAEAGILNTVVESDIVDDPQLPFTEL